MSGPAPPADAVEIFPAGDGRLAVVFRYRPDRVARIRQISGRRWVNGGEPFIPEKRVSSRTSCPDGSRWGGGGAWWGLVADATARFRLLWSDAREGRFHLRTEIIDVVHSEPANGR